MSTLKVNSIESFTGASPVTINDQLVITGSTASGTGAVAFGSQTSATGFGSYSQGRSTIAEGNFSHAEGKSTNPKGSHSHAEGFASKTFNEYAHAEGRQTEASGSASHTEGYLTITSGAYAHAEGLNTIASGDYQHVQGHYNVANSDPGVFMIIGNGTSAGARSNLIQFRSSSFVLDTNALPTSSAACSTGQLYRTGSGFDEIRIKIYFIKV